MISLSLLVLFLAFFKEGVGVPQSLKKNEFSKQDILDDLTFSLQTEEVSKGLAEFFEELNLNGVIADEKHALAVYLDNPEKIDLFCSVCVTFIDNVLEMAQNGTTIEEIVNLLISLCISLHLGNDVFCNAFIPLIEPQLTWIFLNTDTDGNDFCGTMFVGEGCVSDNPSRNWSITLPPGEKPPISPYPVPPNGFPTMKVLHLSDTHFDPFYLPGSNAVCDEMYYCCRAESGPVVNPEDAAGFWGDYRHCDSTRWMLEAMYSHIYATHPGIDFIVWTGDLIPHNVWNSSREETIYIITETANMIETLFPGIPVFPAVGNHDTSPVNAFPQPYINNEFDISWLYDNLTVLWQKWLPAEVAQNVAYGAYYSTLIKPGLRVLSINTNNCYGYNWWLVHDSHDPAENLEWMAAELDKAEIAGERVYLISHIPPGHSDCSLSWSHQYNLIVSRYEKTIASFFYGHTHDDHFLLFFDTEDPLRVAQVGYIGQSQTTYSDSNPGYKIYTIDGSYPGSTFTVLDFESWYMDLDYANANNVSQFLKLYSAKDAYNLTSLTPNDWLDVVIQMNEPNSTLFDDFYRYYTKNSRPKLENGCSQNCKDNLLCRLVKSDTTVTTQCDILLSLNSTANSVN